MHTSHHEDHATASAAGAASWMVAMIVVGVLAVAAVIALFVWMPWEDNDGGTTVPGAEQVVPDDGEDGLDVNADVDVNSGQ